MAYFSRLIRFFIAVLLLSSGSSFAATCTTPGYVCVPARWSTADYNNTYLPGFTSSASAAQARITSLNGAPSQLYTYTLGSFISEVSGTATYYFSSVVKSTGAPATTNGQFGVQAYCSAGDLVFHSGKNVCAVPKAVCTGSDVYDPATNTCEAPPPPCAENQERDSETGQCVCKSGPAGSFVVSGDTYIGCNNGCVIALTGGSYSAAKNKTYGDWRQTGDACTPSPGSPGVDDPNSPDGQDSGKCPIGQCPGTINGQSVCVPCKAKESSDSSSSENTSQTPNGASSPSSSSSESSSGSKSTECDGGVCVTKEKVVVVNPDGSTTEKEKETTESISDFCAKNPKAAICKAVEDGRWGGSCSGGFQCSGDAVQCAQAQAAWKSACAADVSGMTDQINAGTAAMAAGAASGLGLPGGDSAFDLASRLSSAPLFGSSGSCPSDVTVSVSGQSYTLPFSSMCPNLRILGAALMAFAYLVAGFIVFRGDKS